MARTLLKNAANINSRDSEKNVLRHSAALERMASARSIDPMDLALGETIYWEVAIV